MSKAIKNHFPRKKDFINAEEFVKFEEDSHLKENPDVFYFQILHVKDVRGQFGSKIPHIKYPYYLAVIVKNGQFKVSVGLSAFQVEGYSLVFAAANQIYSWEDLSENSDFYYLTFSPSFILNDTANKNLLNELPFFSLANKPFMVLNEKEGTHLYDVFTTVYKEYNDQLKNKDVLLRLKTLELLFLDF